MAWTQADVDALDTAIKSGVLRVQFTDRSVTYQKLSDLLTARSMAVAEVAAANNTPINRTIRPIGRNGWQGW